MVQHDHDGIAGPAESLHDGATAIAQQAQKVVLVVEDDDALRTVLSTRIEAEGMVAFTARDGIEAQHFLCDHEIDVVVLDLGLPDQNGLDLMLEMASRGALPPVVVLTGADRFDCDLARVLGASHVLQKPCPYWLLADAIEQATS